MVNGEILGEGAQNAREGILGGQIISEFIPSYSQNGSEGVRKAPRS